MAERARYEQQVAPDGRRSAGLNFRATPEGQGSILAKGLGDLAGGLQDVSQTARFVAQKESDLWVANEVSKAETYWLEKWNTDFAGEDGNSEKFRSDYDSYMQDVLAKAPTGASSDRLTLQLNDLGRRFYASALRKEAADRVGGIRGNADGAVGNYNSAMTQSKDPDYILGAFGKAKEVLEESKGVLNDYDRAQLASATGSNFRTSMQKAIGPDAYIAEMDNPESDISKSYYLGRGEDESQWVQARMAEDRKAMQRESLGNKYSDRWTTDTNIQAAHSAIRYGDALPDMSMLSLLGDANASTYGSSAAQKAIENRQGWEDDLAFRAGRQRMLDAKYGELDVAGATGNPKVIEDFSPQANPMNRERVFNDLNAERIKIKQRWDNDPVPLVLSMPDSGLKPFLDQLRQAAQEFEASRKDAQMSGDFQSVTEAKVALEQAANAYGDQMLDFQINQRGLAQSNARVFSDGQLVYYVGLIRDAKPIEVANVIESTKMQVGPKHFMRFMDEATRAGVKGANLPPEYAVIPYLWSDSKAAAYAQFLKQNAKETETIIGSDTSNKINRLFAGTEAKPTKEETQALADWKTFKGLAPASTVRYLQDGIVSYARFLSYSNPGLALDKVVEKAVSDTLTSNFYFTGGTGVPIARKKEDGSVYSQDELEYMEDGMNRIILKDPKELGVDAKQLGSLLSYLKIPNEAKQKLQDDLTAGRIASIIKRYAEWYSDGDEFYLKLNYIEDGVRYSRGGNPIRDKDGKAIKFSREQLLGASLQKSMEGVTMGGVGMKGVSLEGIVW